VNFRSSSPPSGVTITVAPTDKAGFGDGSTQFTRTFDRNAVATLTAPNRTSGNIFLKWLRNGADFATTASSNLTMDADYTMTAMFVAPRQIYVKTATSNAAAVDSVTFVRGPFPALLSVQAGTTPLTVEAVGPISGAQGLTGSYVVVRLPDGLPTGNLSLTLTLGGVTSNATTLSIVP